uniref:Putative dd34d transposase n=1 Tax=Lutzomyia longipalpis TaxID=7200 RepID=A0A1B0CMM0_LUTLO
MTERIGQRICIKFCVKLGYTAAETTRLIQKAFKDDPISVTQTKLWHRRFRDGRESAESDARSGRPTTSKTPENIEHIRAAYSKGEKVTMRQLADELGIQKSTVYEIVSGDYGPKRETTKFKEKELQSEDSAKGTGYKEQETCIKFCSNLGHSCAETVQMILGAFKEEALSEEDIETLFNSFRCSKDGGEKESKQDSSEDSDVD